MRRLNLDDMVRLQHIAEAEISPDGRWAAAVVHSFLTDRNAVTRQVFVVGLNSDGGVRQISPREAKDSSVSWGPDSNRLAFVASHGNAETLQVYDTSTGDCRQLLANMPGLVAPRWSPDGQRIAFLAYGPPVRGQPREERPTDPAGRLD